MRRVLARLLHRVVQVGAVGSIVVAAVAVGCSGGDNTDPVYTPAPLDTGTGDVSPESDAAKDTKTDAPDAPKDASDAKDAPLETADSPDTALDTLPEADSGQDVIEAGDAKDEESCAANFELCNGVDDNCNGQVDEGNPGGNLPCDVPNKQGECKAGTTHCQNTALKCVQDLPPAAELCDGKDNDCNGTIDNNTTDTGGSCNTGGQGICAAGTEVCEAGAKVCKQNLQPGTETCNGLDDNCNGQVDEGFSGSGQPCTVPGQPVNSPCATGQTNCLGGQNGCTQTVFPSSELCDGKDNDCNGTIDDPVLVDGKVCQSTSPGVCAQGKTACNAGVPECNPDIMPGTNVEICNAKDDDCNGLMDDIVNVKLECATKYPTAQNVLDWQCTTGNCEVTVCAGSYKDCDSAPANGCEVNTLSDLNHCGMCGKLCSANHGTASCVSGQCQIVCAAGWGNCDADVDNGCELPLAGDVNNCGTCAKKCESATGTPSCAAGVCAISCNAGLGNCDGNVDNGCETTLANNVLHCGSCAGVCSTVGGAPACTAGLCSITCNSGLGNCDGNVSNGCESNINTDPGHCGICTKICNNTNGTAGCLGGVCSITCAAGYGNCDGLSDTGCEVNLKTSATNCNACGQLCNGTHGTPSCVNGACQIACAGGYGNCDNDPSDGCEVTFANDILHCGNCTKVCSTVHGTPSCAAGVCSIACAANYANCDNNVDTGCEADLKNDEAHCGNCTTVCSSSGGSPSCNNGVCGITCTAGLGDCDGNTANGCETNINTSLAHCGGCSHPCSNANGTPSCSAGACSIACNAGFGNCNLNVADGCEVALGNNLAHCGVCGNACSAINGTPSCSGGTCSIVCNPGYANCDNNPANGCEVNLTNNVANCGACNAACNSAGGVAFCAASACGINCSAGYGNCDNNAANGCEINLTNNVAYCGACNTPCNSTNGVASCSGSQCSIACNAGFGNCDNSAANGCEINLNTNPLYCGACNKNCNSPLPQHTLTTGCSGGGCTVASCESGWYNTDGFYNTGCECQTDGYADSCAAATDLGSIPVEGTLTKVGNLVPTGDADWFVVQFDVGPSCSFNPKIVLTNNGNPIRMQVYTNCSGGSIPCADNTNSAVNSTSWEFTYQLECGINKPIDYWDFNTVGVFIGYDMPSPVNYFITLYVKVSAIGSNGGCLPYSLALSN